MAQFESRNASLDAHTYTPPCLPDCLSDVHSLKPIVGMPSSEEVKAIHAAIRGLNGILAAPALYDADLPMQLAQHLFEVQMAVYRSTYNIGLISVEATYTPPKLPSHIPIPLGPVVGAPSDEDIRLAQSAVRTMESLASNPHIFDPNLSANLSQHLFNIQAARYIQYSTQGRFTSSKSKDRRTRSNEIEHVSSQEQATDIPESIDPAHAATEQSSQNQSQATLRSDVTRETKSTPDYTNQLIQVLKSINNALVSSQHDFAKSGYSGSYYRLMNQNGELPSKYALPQLNCTSKNPSGGGGSYSCMGYYGGSHLSESDLASYLRFYDLGAGLLQENNGELAIVPDKTDEAAKLLYKHLAAHPRSGWAASS